MKCTPTLVFRTGHARGFLLRDPTIGFANKTGLSTQTLHRAGGTTGMQRIRGTHAGKAPVVGHAGGTHQYNHAFPLLTHTDFGNKDHAGNTKWAELNNYMPKRHKGSAPWFRGADTYSALFAEQGRYEYKRYMMVQRFPMQYRTVFARALQEMRLALQKWQIPQFALHVLLKLIVDGFNPQHIHYLTCMQVLMTLNEFDMAFDVWKVMERQQVWPDDKLIIQYLDLCSMTGERDLALECWNRYCTEKKFLEEGEADPKPISRIPFALNREELLFLPKWKKFFDHDPNLDVTDLNRFNRTRDIYLSMSCAMLASGEKEMFETLFGQLMQKLLETPSPVPEPPNPLFVERPQWAPHLDEKRIFHSPWHFGPESVDLALGPRDLPPDQNMHRRFTSNDEFALIATAKVIQTVTNSHRIRQTEDSDFNLHHTFEPLVGCGLGDHKAQMSFCEDRVEFLFNAIGDSWALLDTDMLFTEVLEMYRVLDPNVTGMRLYEKANELLSRKGQANARLEQQEFGEKTTLLNDSTSEIEPNLKNVVKEAISERLYLMILQGFVDECHPGRSEDPRGIVKRCIHVVNEMCQRPKLAWTAAHHLAITQVLSACGTLKANEYFVANVLRKFQYGSEFYDALYAEYRRQPNVELWAELTKRMLVWAERYDVQLSERTKRSIEDDYPTIGVHVRSFREVAVFYHKHQAEKAERRDPRSQLPNPVMDYVSHALPFPDRDTGYPNEYGDIGQWRDPESGIKGPEYYSPVLPEEQEKGFTAEWRDQLKNKVDLPSPWKNRYDKLGLNKQGKHPSYDVTYAGQFPEIFPARFDFRQKSRWDFQQVEHQSKYKASGPF